MFKQIISYNNKCGCFGAGGGGRGGINNLWTGLNNELVMIKKII